MPCVSNARSCIEYPGCGPIRSAIPASATRCDDTRRARGSDRHRDPLGGSVRCYGRKFRRSAATSAMNRPAQDCGLCMALRYARDSTPALHAPQRRTAVAYASSSSGRLVSEFAGCLRLSRHAWSSCPNRSGDSALSGQVRLRPRSLSADLPARGIHCCFARAHQRAARLRGGRLAALAEEPSRRNTPLCGALYPGHARCPGRACVWQRLRAVAKRPVTH